MFNLMLLSTIIIFLLLISFTAFISTFIYSLKYINEKTGDFSAKEIIIKERQRLDTF